MHRSYSIARGFSSHYRPPPSGRAAYCTPCRTPRSCDPPHVPRDDLAGYCILFGRVASCTSFGRGANDTPCSTVHGSCAPAHVHHDDLAGYCTPFHELWVTPPPVGTVYPSSYATMTSPSTVPPLARPASAAPLPPSLGTVNPYIYTTANPAPVPTLPPQLDPVVPAERDAPPP